MILKYKIILVKIYNYRFLDIYVYDSFPIPKLNHICC